MVVMHALGAMILHAESGPMRSWHRYVTVVADSRRRHTLYWLSAHRGETISLETVARQVAAFEAPYSPDTLVETEYAMIQQELYHNHLPRLADYGFIEFDPQRKVVHCHRLPRLLRSLLWLYRFIERLS